MFDFIGWLDSRTALVEEALDRLLPAEDLKPPQLHRAMRYSVFTGGKRLRPLLLLAAAEAAGGADPGDLLAPACAIEFVHTYSLIHDDLPAMDNDDFRRGKPTCHRVFGEAIALLAGDALLTLAFECLAGTAAAAAPARRIELIRELAGAAGSVGMVGGQAAELAVAEVAAGSSRTALGEADEIYRRKTGALFRAAVRMGGILAGADDRELEALTSYAADFGLAFQIVDDIHDFDPGAGRRTQLNYPAQVGLEEARRVAADLMRQAGDGVRVFGSRAESLRAIAGLVLASAS